MASRPHLGKAGLVGGLLCLKHAVEAVAGQRVSKSPWDNADNGGDDMSRQGVDIPLLENLGFKNNKAKGGTKG